jgi:hypothetical protein
LLTCLRVQPGTKTFISRANYTAGLRADAANGPAYKVAVNFWTHTCETIIFKYHIFGGRVAPSSVGGIDWLFVDLESRKIKVALSEFNSAAFLYNFGIFGPPNATACLNGACDIGGEKVVQGCGSRK